MDKKRFMNLQEDISLVFQNSNTINSINELSRDIAKLNSRKGFWDSFHLIQNLANAELRANCNNSELTTKVALAIGELSEAIEALRKAKKADTHYAHSEIQLGSLNNPDYIPNFQKKFEYSVKDSFEDELADALIRIFDLCGKLNIDIGNHIMLKLIYNSTRPVKHGKLF